MNTCEKYAAAFDALGHPVRLALFLLIIECNGTQNVNTLVERLNTQLHSSLEQSTISHHLKALREAGFIEATRQITRKRGKERKSLERFYVVCPDALVEMAHILKAMSRQEVSA